MKRSLPTAYGRSPGKTLLLLEELEGWGHVSQRRLGQKLEMTGSLVNRLIGRLREEGHVEVVDPDVRPFAYRLTARGRRYRTRLFQEHCRDVLDRFEALRERIRGRLRGIREKGLERLALYGSGDLARLTASLAPDAGLRVVAVVDDDPEAREREEAGFVVVGPDALPELAPDAVLNTSLRPRERVRARIDRAVEDSELPLLEL